jgi:hypothetical protein
MSYFNRDIICPLCRRDERLAPNYRRAVDAEANAVLRGDYNFTGIGLAPEDEAVLRGLRATRAPAQGGGDGTSEDGQHARDPAGHGAGGLLS